MRSSLEPIGVAAAAVASALLFTSGAFAQGVADPEGADGPMAGATVSEQESEDAAASKDDRIAELERKLEEQKRDFDQRISAIEEAQEDQALDDLPTGFEPSFDIYGFFDLSFNKFVPQEGGFFDGVLHGDSSFFMQNLNLYFNSRMTESLSAIAELGFTFAPTGQERSIEVEGFSDFERAETSSTDPFHAEETRLGGLRIERVHLTWRPSDYFGVVAGRFLTPFGIWNIEHGSPVLISIRPPLMQTKHLVPLSQTGVQVFGDFHLKPGHMLQYALTLSNGRGPMDEVYDLDANKAGGLRLRYVFDNPKTRFALGGYGYTGKYTDKHHRIASIQPFDLEYYTVEQYQEWIGTLDALIEAGGFRAQAEYGRRLVLYQERPLQLPEDGGGYPADFVSQAVFVMVSYTLPLEKYIGDFGITPYVSGDHMKDNDVDHRWGCTLVAGLNLRPSPFVVLKAEYYTTVFPEWHTDAVEEGTMEEATERFWGIAAQMAVSF